MSSHVHRLLALVLAGFILRCASAAAQLREFPLQSHHSRINALGCFEFKASASLGWSPKETYDALIHPEETTPPVSSVRLLRVLESGDHDCKILEWNHLHEWSGRPGTSEVWFRDEYLFDRRHRKVSVERVAEPPLSAFITTYQVAAAPHGRGTLLSITELQCPRPDSPTEFASRESQTRSAEEASRGVQLFIAGVDAYLINLHRKIPNKAEQPRPGETATPSVHAP